MATTRELRHQLTREPAPRHEAPSEQDYLLLAWLLRYPFQRMQDLALALAATRATLYRRLAHLQRLSLVESVEPAALGTEQCRLYHLSNAGLLLLSARLRRDPRALARQWGCDEAGLLRLLAQLPALVDLQHWVNALIIGAPGALGTAELPVLVRWHWLRNLRARERRRPLPPAVDAAVVFQVVAGSMGTMAGAVAGAGSERRGQAGQQAGHDVRWYALYLLRDGEVDDLRHLSQRAEQLVGLQAGSGSGRLDEPLPPLLVLTPTAHRAAQWQDVVAAACLRWHRVAVPGGVAIVPRPIAPDACDAPPGDPWRLAWYDLVAGTPRRLTDLLAPLDQHTVPSPLLDTAVLPRREPHSEPDTDKTAHPPRARLIHGAFAARSHGLLAASGATRQGRRGTCADTRLLALALGRRQWQLLDLLCLHPLLSDDELAAALELAASSVQHALAPLQRHACVWAPTTATTRPETRWLLTGAGVRLVASAHQLQVRQLVAPARMRAGAIDTSDTVLQRDVTELLRHLAHTAGVYSFFAALLRAATCARQTGEAHRLLWWETSGRCARRYRYQQRWHNLRPDGSGEYAAGGRQVTFWLEWDRGTMGGRDLADKGWAYAQYLASREWCAAAGGTVPQLLVVAPDAAREATVARALGTAAPAGADLSIWTTTAARLEERGPLAGIWQAWRLSAAPILDRSPFVPPPSTPLGTRNG